MEASTQATAYLAAVKSDLKTFIHHAFRTLNENTAFIDNWHIDAIVYQLDQAIKGRHRRLILNMPPRHLKSFLVSVALPAFILGHDPTAKIICVSYSERLATDLSDKFRRIIESEWYRCLFPEVRARKNTDNQFTTDLGGCRYTTSVGGSLTGLGGDFILIDDPMKPEDAYSDTKRTHVNEWFRDVVMTRLDDPSRGVMILAMQRLHVNDLSGYMESMGGIQKLSLPAIALEDCRIPVGPNRSYWRRQGELLHPSRLDEGTLETLRKGLGPANFNAQYQQAPDSPEGEIFKKAWFQEVDCIPERPDGMWTISVDTALKPTAMSDRTAISVVYSDASGHYVRYAMIGNWTYEELLSLVLRIRRNLRRDCYFVVEAAGVGYSLATALYGAGEKCFWYFPNDNKVTRAYRVVPVLSAGRLHIYVDPDENRRRWVKPYVDEFLMFPNGRFDDQVDSLTQLLPLAERRVNPGGNYIAGYIEGRYKQTGL